MALRKNPGFGLSMVLALAVVLLAFAAAMVLGAADISAKEVYQALLTSETGDKLLIIREIRLPREIAALMVGAALAVSGAIMQGMTKNPLADPGLLGLTAGANAALTVVMTFAAGLNHMGILMACFVGAGAGVLMVYGLSASRRGGFTPFRVVLAGAAVSAFLFAVSDGLGLYFKVSKDVSMWTMGGLVGVSWSQLGLVMPFIGFGLLAAMAFGKQLTLLSLSEETAVGLGQNTRLTKAFLMIITVLLAGASVALAGNLAFVGLMIPHLARRCVGSDYRRILPFSMLLGGALMLAADTAARILHAPYETPVSAVVAVLGLPFFLYIVHKGAGERT